METSILGRLFGSFLGNWKIFTIAASLLIGLYAWHIIKVDALKAQQVTDLADQKKTLDDACDHDKQITTGAQNALQDDRDRIAAGLIKYKRLHPNQCVVAISSSGAGITSSRAQHAGSYGVASDALRDFAADCEQYRSEVLTLTTFVREERIQN